MTSRAVHDRRVDEVAKLELDPKPSTTGISHFYYIPGPWIGKNAIPAFVFTHRAATVRPAMSGGAAQAAGC
jgi:hypothetical protein